MIDNSTLRQTMNERARDMDLARIERYARHAVNDAANIVGAVRLLRGQPAFETRAAEILTSAATDLEIALSAVRKAMQEFSTKPVTA